MASDDLERLLGPDYLGDVQSRSMEEVRAMRDECRRAEDGLSYVRRQAQGRLDIVASELTRRAEGKGRPTAAAFAAQLPPTPGPALAATTGGIGNLARRSFDP